MWWRYDARRIRKHIEKDRRWTASSGVCGEPTVEDTIAILRGLKERYEVHTACASPTAPSSRRRRYLTGTWATVLRTRPRLDRRGASRLRIESTRSPGDRRGRARMCSSASGAGAGSGNRQAGKERKAAVRASSRSWRPRRRHEGQCSGEGAIQALRDKKAALDSRVRRAGDAEGRPAKGAEITYGKVPELERQIAAEQKRLGEIQQRANTQGRSRCRGRGRDRGQWTGIP